MEETDQGATGSTATIDEEAASTQDEGTSTESGEAEGQQKLDWRALIRDVPPEELLQEHEALRKHFDGKAGQTGLRLAREKYLPEELAKERDRLLEQVRSQVEQENARKERERRLDSLADLAESDPDRAASELRKLRSEEKNAEAEQVNKQEIEKLVTDSYQKGLSEIDTGVLHPLFRTLHVDDQKELAGKNYTGTHAEARMKYLVDILGAREKRAAIDAVAAAQEEWKKGEEKRMADAKEAGRKEALGESNGGVKVDTGSGTRSGGAQRWEDIQALPPEERTKFRRENPAAYNAAVAAHAGAR